jgi:hypothetical protein
MTDTPRTNLSVEHPFADDPMRRLARRLLHGSIVVGLLSAGGACVVYALLVAPWSLASFQRAELPVPAFLAAVGASRWWLAAGVCALIVLGIAALHVRRAALIGLLIALGALAMLIVGAVAGLISWWVMYIEAMRAQMPA